MKHIIKDALFLEDMTYNIEAIPEDAYLEGAD
jgi:hypothetical protein